MTRTEDDVRPAFFSVAFEGIARDRRPEEQQIVEIRQLALGAGAANVVNACRRRSPDLRQGLIVESIGFARYGSWRVGVHGLRCSVLVGVIDIEIIKLAGRAIAAKLLWLRIDLRPIEQSR